MSEIKPSALPECRVKNYITAAIAAVSVTRAAFALGSKPCFFKPYALSYRHQAFFSDESKRKIRRSLFILYS